MPFQISRHAVDRGLEARFYANNFKVAPVYKMAQLASLVSRDIWSPCIWRYGNRAKSNFLAADFIGLDFDDPGTTLVQARELFAGHAHVIGTTKSHQKDKGGVVCDRFRVVLQLERRVENLEEYEHTAATIFVRYKTDPAVKDGGRFFFPCAEIVSVSESGEFIPVATPKVVPNKDAAQRNYNRYRLGRFQQYPGWLAGFLEKGSLTKSGGRNNTVYAAARELADLNIPQAQALGMIRTAPFDRTDFDDQEILVAIKSGFGGRS